MSSQNIQLVILDMAGTTILDEHEVEHCFKIAAQKNGLNSSDDRILALQGYAKLYVFQTLWAEQLGEGDPTINQKAKTSYEDFTQILEQHYLNHEVKPTEGCLELFDYLHQHGIYIALTSGFYRKVANIILDKIGWGKSLNQNYMNIQNKSGIHLSICPDEVQGAGRPSPSMIELAMLRFGISDKSKVINVGDTPVDLAFGKNAGIRLALGVCNGTHTREQLASHPNDGLLNNIAELIPIIEKLNHEKI
ncbi:HAD family hydrolase [Aquirufa nivalisilvae]